MKGRTLIWSNALLLLMCGILIFGCNEFSSVTNFGVGTNPFNAREDDLVGVDVKVITPGDGGTMKVSNTTLFVPPGAFEYTYTCTFKIYAKTPPWGLTTPLGRVYDFAPEGEQFDPPATLTVPFTDTDLGTGDPSSLKCYYYNKATLLYEEQPTIVDKAKRQFRVTIRHFSQYSFGRVEAE